LVGVPVYQEGYFLHLPGFTMEIAGACSGLRQLVAIVALGVAIGYLSGRGSVFRWSLGLLAIPIAVAANCLRVVLSGVIIMKAGRDWGEGVFHAIEGLAIIALSAGLLVAAAWGMARLEDKWDRKHAASTPSE
jgi:exosortase